ncbi:28S ribosomal protein S27, mitochondrial [Synchiropus splendidus]|uniref:28S ribosomal protein S27, mitochondrial n=1 Tax=Synchiropus splendidus TaxID=270530 RepID=UPI00237DB990|nr:28S ribosomal protein S27, mitochondrial [Synchiropus splendidus]
MAACVLKRCVTVAVKVKSLSPSFSARRWLLSAAYTDTKLWEAREKDPQNLALLANSMDRTYEKNLPVSSLTMGRFVDNISSREEVDQTEYYLYKFRHSPNCWYLRDWTIHSWVRQCLKYGAREKALHTLKNKVQYGIFPDNFTFNILMDSYIKENDFKNACSVVEEVMLQEAFDLPSIQILSFYSLGCYLATKPQLTVSQERALGASLLICGLQHENSVGLSAQLLGCVFLGKVEMLNGINGVYKGMPLDWTRGYLGRAFAVMERVATNQPDVKLTKDTLDYISDILQELSSSIDTDSSGEESSGEEDQKVSTMEDEDLEEQAKLPEYISRFKELSVLLESQGKVDSASFKDLVTEKAKQDLAAAEKSDIEEYETRIQTWEDERKNLVHRERELRMKAELEREERLAARAAAQQA